MADSPTSKPTIGILIVAHGDLAAGLVSAAEEILGPQESLVHMKLEAGAAGAKQKVQDVAKQLDQGFGVLALTDLFGGTPSNVTLAASADCEMEVVTGISLPLLIRALTKRDTQPLTELASSIAEYGRRQILTPNSLLEKAAS